MATEDTFKKLNEIKSNPIKKGKFNYLSWSDAWTEFKAAYPNAEYTIYENSEGFPCFYSSNGGMVKVGVKVGEIEYINWMPVMDYMNKSITKDKITTFDINKSIQRCFVKAIAMHGLGLYIFRGEDIPEGDLKDVSSPGPTKNCEKCNAQITDKVADYSQRTYKKIICMTCQEKVKEGGK